MNRIRPYPNILQSFGITGIVVIGMVVMTPVNLLFTQWFGKEPAMLVYYLLSVGIPTGVVYYIRKMINGSSGFPVRTINIRIFPFVLLGTFTILLGICTPIVMLIPMPESIKELFMQLDGKTDIFTISAVVIAAPILEELIFRGVILDGLLKSYSQTKSILVSGMLFGLVHLNPWQFISAFILGCFFGWVYSKTRNIVYPILMHAFSNLSVILMNYFFADEGSSVDDHLVELYGGVSHFILINSGLICISVFCIYVLNKGFKKLQQS